jgi:hypothetical protein
MGHNRIQEHSVPQQIFLSVDNDKACTPHRFILQHVKGKAKKRQQ